MRINIKVILAVLILLATGVWYVHADVLFQDFENYQDVGGADVRLTGVYTNSTGWIVSDGRVRNYGAGYSYSPTNAAWFENDGDYPNAWLQLPPITNGIGSLIFWARNWGVSSIEFQILTSTNGTNWSVFTTQTSTNQSGWSQYTVVLNIYTPVSVRIFKSQQTLSGQWLGLDDVQTTEAPAKVNITDVATYPDTPEANDPVNISCTITPSALASNVSAVTYYRIGISGPFTAIGMTTSAPTSYTTTNAIPGQPAGNRVQYYIKADFLGPYAMSPTNYPAQGSNAPASYVVQARPFLTEYKFMNVLGSASTNMILVDTYLWQGILNTTGALTNAGFRFEGISTNLSITNTWGDTNQQRFDLPVAETAELSGSNIVVSAMESNSQFLFRLNESNLSYSVRQCAYQDFDVWTNAESPGNYSNNGWYAYNAFIKQDNDRKHTMKACFLSNDVSSIRSPYLKNGIGEISFWYMNGETDGDPLPTLYIQKSKTGGTNDNEWTTIQTNLVSVTNYIRHILPANDRYYNYVRIKNGTNGWICLDEVLTAHPGAGVVMTNLVHTPEFPQVDDPVNLFVDVEPRAGVSNWGVTAYYRSGATGAFTNISMSNTVGNTYATITPVPAGMGGGAGGAGTVQYYISCTFQGYESEYAQPVLYPEDGSNSPAAYSVSPFTSDYANISVTGPFDTGLILIDNYVWQGVASFTTNIINAQFQFSGTNGSTTAWGDANQSVFNLPVYGNGETNASDILISGTNTGHFVFQFNETNQEYSVQRCAYVNFDDWSGASSYKTYTNAEGWIMIDSRTTTDSSYDQSRVFRGKSCIMDYDTDIQYVLSPYLSNGIGEISFWYRNWETDGDPATKFYVRISADGATGWETVATVTNIVTMDYTHFSITLSDRYNRYVQILHSTNPPRARLCLDEIIVSEPGAGVVFSNLTNNPTSPTILDTVDVSVNIISIGGATNLSAMVWYRAGTNGNFESLAMTNISGTLFQTLTPIPRREPGIMQYYVQCSYTGFGSKESSPAYYPPGGSNNPAAYTNTDVLQAFQDFENYQDVGGADVRYTGVYTNSAGWIVSDGKVRNYGAGYSYSPTNAAWFENDGDYPNAYLQLPSITNGIGSLIFWARNMGVSTIEFQILTSTNGTNWNVFTTLTSTNQSGWSQYTVVLNIYTPVSVRIFKSQQTSSGQWLGLDDVEATYPPAQVQFANMMIHPGYPSSDQSVDISVYITSARTNPLAFDIQGAVYHRRQGEGSFQGPIPMTKSEGYFITSTGIPPYPERAVVEYYVESTFKGYHHDSTNMSPMFCASNYTVRSYLSQYDHLAVTSNVGTATMELFDDNYWQGIIDLPGSTNQLTLSFSGFGHYTNWADEYATEVDSWGDSSQIRFILPLSGTGQTNGSNIVVSGQLDGWILVRYNPVDNTYLVMRCAYQNFNEWRASTEYFEESLDVSDITTSSNTFNTWPTNGISSVLPGTSFEDCQGWATNYWDARSDISSNGWYVQKASIIDEVDNRACSLHEDPIAEGRIWPHRSALTDGLKTFRFNYRASYPDHYHAWYTNGMYWTNYYVEATLRSTTMSPEYPYLSMFARYQNESNYYEYRLKQDTKVSGVNKLRVQLLRRSSGQSTLISQSGTFDGSLLDGHVGKFSVVTNNNGYVYLEGYCDGSLYSTAYDTSGDKSHKPGSIGFLSRNADLVVDNITARRMDIQRFEQWSQGGYGTYANAGWIISDGYPNYDYCVLNTALSMSQNFDGWSTNDWGTYTNSGWVLSDGRISTNDYRSSPNSAWLKHDVTNSYLRTPQMTNGLGIINFYCKNTGTNSIVFKVETSPNGTDSWTTFTTLTNTDTSNWIMYNVRIHTNAAIYARILKSQITQNGHWLGLDDISVGRSPSVATITSPYLDYSSGELKFQYYSEVAGADLGVLGSTNGSDWDTINVVSNFYTGWYNKTLSNISNYRYLRIANLTPHYRIFIQDIYITQSASGASATNTVLPYSQDFSSGATSWNAPYGYWYVAGGTYNRDGYLGPQIGFVFQTATTNTGDEFEPNSSAWTNIASLTASNLTYSTANIDVEYWDRLFVRVKHTAGEANPVVDNLKATSWRGKTNSDTNGWSATESWVAERGPATDHCIELWRSRANPANDQYLKTPLMTNGVGTIEFDVKVANPPAEFKIERAVFPLTNNFVTVETVTRTNTNWSSYSLAINMATAMVVRVLHTSTNNSVLYVDNTEVTDYAQRDNTMWYAYNALITHNQNTREFEPDYQPDTAVKTCYLNYNSSTGTKSGVTLNQDMPYVQSPFMSRGIGEISFWYRTWETAGAPSATIYLRSAPVETNPPEEWTQLGEISGITNTEYHYFTTNFYITDDRFMRFYCNTNSPTAKRVCLDNVLITEPISANLDIGNLTITPAIPLYTNSVRLSADLSNFLLSPSNIQVKAYYNIGTNNWGNWTTNNWIPLNFVTNIAGTYTYVTPAGQGIPAQGIDTVVQYYVYCTFDGLLASNASPKIYKEFSNPSWYYPVNLNQTHGKTNPYYFVFSCLPNTVWINEINYRRHNSESTNEYVELCGPAGTDIYNWKIELLDTGNNLYDFCLITNGTPLPNDTNGYGFFVYGDTNVATVDIAFASTNDQNILQSGGIRLMRSMGAWEQLIAYGPEGYGMTNFGYEYISVYKAFLSYAPIHLEGTGTGYTNFSWAIPAAYNYTPGIININQTLQGQQNGAPPLVEIEITDFWLTSTNVWIVCTGTNDWQPTAWYSTNLINTNWFLVTNSQYSYSSGIYTQWFNIMTNSRNYFYKVIATNTP